MVGLNLVTNYEVVPEGFTEVKQGEWKATETDGPLGTLGVSSCAVVMLRNPFENRGYLGHFASPHAHSTGHQTELDDMLANVKEIEKDSQVIEAWVSGTTLSGKDTADGKLYDSEALADRDHVFGRLANNISGITYEALVVQDWLHLSQELAVVTFDPGREVPVEYILRSLPPAQPE
jgi:hypothetical protein